MKYTARFSTARRLVSLRSRATGESTVRRSHTPRHEALAVGLGCGRTASAHRPEWR